MNTEKLAIVLPCYNPPADWTEWVCKSYREIEKHLGFEPALIVVNDGSSQNICQNVKHIETQISKFTFIDCEINKGKGAALRKGVARANAELIIYTDIDFPYTTESFMELYSVLEKKESDIAIGVKDDAYYSHLPKYRKFISKALRKGIGFFFNMPITDTQCGLKGFNEKGKALFLETTIDRYLFDLEFVYQAFRKKRNLSIQPVKVTLRPNVIFRKMNLKIISEEGRNFLKIMLKK